MDEYDLQLTLRENKQRMQSVLQLDVADLKRVKWYVIAYIECQVGEGEEGEPVEKFLRSSNVTTLRSETLSEDLENAFRGVINSYDKTQVEGSSMLFQGVKKLELRVAKYSPLKRSSYLPLPEWLRKSSKGLVNIQNYGDEKCFLWSCLAGLRLPRSHPERVAKYQDRTGELRVSGLKFPLKVQQISKFENQNPHVSVSVFALEGDKVIVPLRVSPNIQTNHVNLLLLEEGDCSHYVLIKDISRFLSHLSKQRRKLYWCENCLTPRANRLNHVKHRQKCVEQDAQAIKMPDVKNSMMYFHDHGSRMKHDYVIYCDLEAVLEPYETAYPNPEQSNTTRINRHIASGFCYVVVCADGTLLKPPVLAHGPESAKKLLQMLKREEKELMSRRGRSFPIDMTPDSTRKFENATHCYMCEQVLPRAGVLKVRDHDHSKEKDNFRGAACGPCNLNLKPRNYIPVVMHNLSGYDAHHIISAIGELSDGSDLSVIPKTKEKYVSFQWGNLRFLDSFGFLSSSLDRLVKDLEVEEMRAINSMFPQVEKRDLLTRKGVYPYAYFDSFEKFEENELPPREKFQNDLTGEELSVKDYEHAQKVWSTFNMSSLWDYHDLYLLTDTLLLCDVMENYRLSSMSQFKLDVIHYFTTPGFAWSAALSDTKEKLELITDIDHHLFFEKAIRGGVATISCRYAEANNTLLPETYDSQKPSSYIMYYDCNALYATAMCRKLPVGGFRFLNDSELEEFDISLVNNDDEVGYLIECDLEYPDNLHDVHNDYPLAPEHMSVKYESLSALQRQMLDEYNMCKTSSTKKLIPNLSDKKEYCVYSSPLQLYLKLGMKIVKISRVLEFYQKAWLEPFVNHNIEMRKLAKTDFKKSFFKLLNNATYGKTIESVRKRRNVVLTKEQEKFRKLVKSPLYHSFEVFDHGMVAVERRKATVVLNRPIFTGCVILEIAKEIMYSFHYEVMKPRYGQNLSLLATDTDSLIYKIVCPSIYDDMSKMSYYFDTSEYDNSHPLHSNENRRQLGKFKDEMMGMPIKAFVGLKAKMYSFKRGDNVEKAVGKGIPRLALKKQVDFDDYKSCLEERSLKMVRYSKISTDQKHHLYQTYSSKRGLSAYDDKRYILSDNKTTLAYGHYRLDVCEGDECESEEDNILPVRDFDNDEASQNLRALIEMQKM